MANFVRTSAPGGGVLYWINVDAVNFVQQAKNDPKKCTVKFSDDRSITVEMSGDELTAQIASTRERK